jgi:hypothetical protein
MSKDTQQAKPTAAPVAAPAPAPKPVPVAAPAPKPVVASAPKPTAAPAHGSQRSKYLPDWRNFLTGVRRTLSQY